MTNKIKTQLKIINSLLRKPTYLLLNLYLVVGFLLGISTLNTSDISLSSILELVVCSVIIALWYISGTALNDYADYEIDKINLKDDPDRPLLSGIATKSNLLVISAYCSTLGLALAALLSYQQLLITLLLTTLNIAYSLKPLQISRRGGLGPLLLPLGYIVLPFFLGYLISSQTILQSQLIILTFAYYLHFIARIILKDYRDVKGDKANGKLTFLLRHGNKTVCAVSAIASLVSSLLIIIALGQSMSVFKYGLIFSLGFSLMNLYDLSKTVKWSQQKPLLASFGRSMTSITVFTIMGITNDIWPISINDQWLITISIIIVYSWSSKKAYTYSKALTR